MVHRGGVFEDSVSAASSIALQIGGQLFGVVFLAGLEHHVPVRLLEPRPGNELLAPDLMRQLNCPVDASGLQVGP